jgi:hypothetical protein
MATFSAAILFSRNISQWLLKTRERYYKKRYGGKYTYSYILLHAYVSLCGLVQIIMEVEWGGGVPYKWATLAGRIFPENYVVLSANDRKNHLHRTNFSKYNLSYTKLL